MRQARSKAGEAPPVVRGVREVSVREDREGQRIDNFLLATLKGVPRARVYQMLRRGEVRVNGGRVKQHYRLRRGDRLRLPPASTSAPRGKASPALAGSIGQRIIYEDDAVIVINKPSGVAVHGGSGYRHGVIEALRAARPRDRQLELVHRLDRDTSGALLVAKKRNVLKQLHADLRADRVEKRYLALLKGRLRGARLTVRLALRKNVLRSGERVVRSAAGGKAAETTFLVLDKSAEASLCEVIPHTGRTHQIRVHASEIGHPVAGDVKYGERGFNALMRQQGLKRMFLHARLIGFDSPAAGARVRVEAPLEESLMRVLEALGLDAAGTGGETRR